jgi:IS30 family transposase
MGRTYSHLSLEERRRIAKWRDAKMPIAEIADRLGRDASTVYRDLRPNHYDDKELAEFVTISHNLLSPATSSRRKQA